MFTRCIRRHGGPEIWTKYESRVVRVDRDRYKIWRCFGYGYGSVYNCLSSLLSLLCVPSVYSLFSDPQFGGSRFALHAYVQVFPDALDE